MAFHLRICGLEKECAMMPKTEAIAEAIRDCVTLCEHSDQPLTTLAAFCAALRSERGWHEAAIWLVETRVLKMLRQILTVPEQPNWCDAEPSGLPVEAGARIGY
jgi:hypothetical protein